MCESHAQRLEAFFKDTGVDVEQRLLHVSCPATDEGVAWAAPMLKAWIVDERTESELAESFPIFF